MYVYYVTWGNSGQGEFGTGGIRDGACYLSSALYTLGILFMGCNLKVRLRPFHVSATGLNFLL